MEYLKSLYLKDFLKLARFVVFSALCVTIIITLLILGDLLFSLKFGYPWWSLLLILPLLLSLIVVIRSLSKSLSSHRLQGW